MPRDDRPADRPILRKAIGIVIDVLDPHAIVLGGGVGNIDALYTEETREENHRRNFQSAL